MKNISLILLTLFLVFGISSCKKEGCTDVDALNYDSKADKNDNSCKYDGRVSFWFNQDVSGFLVSYNVTTLTIYIDEVAVGSIDVNDWKSGPSCGGNNLTVHRDLGLSKTKSYSYIARDQNGTTHFNGTFVLAANSCLDIQLRW